MAIRIQDDPNHPFYGPVRRLWVVFQTLLADKYDYADEEYVHSWGYSWDETLVRWLAMHDGDQKQVPMLMRAVTERMLKIAH